ncbi:MAG: lipid-A-disaccharide synthase, partial [Thermodesulfobacteriota bacterium]|nr:lipid-A-disaccharide synthase [Thermodesulfobacteriota bacterium]
MGNKKIKKILFVAGEASGDLHGGNLIRSLKSFEGTLYCYGVGGENMRKAGAEIVFNYSRIAVVGATEIFTHLKAIIKVFHWLKRSIRNDRPDLLVLIDYPELNIRLAKYARKRNIKVVYYISPQIWAWRRKRAEKLGRWVTKMLLILPFEADFYKNTELDVEFVGHPLLDEIRDDVKSEQIEIKKSFDLDEDRIVIGLLPGSRKKEVAKLLPVMLETGEILKGRLKNLYFILPLAPEILHEDVEAIIEKYNLHIKIVKNNVYNILKISKIALVASGTATLETAIINTPMIVLYKVSLLSYIIGKLLIKIRLCKAEHRGPFWEIMRDVALWACPQWRESFPKASRNYHAL